VMIIFVTITFTVYIDDVQVSLFTVVSRSAAIA